MTWERYHENYDGMQGLRVFSLDDKDAENVTVKNSWSKRDMPLHDDLVMPSKSIGRILDYKQNKDCLCSHDAGRIINPILQQIVSGRHKSLHSFRITFKVMWRSVGVSEEINNNIQATNMVGQTKKVTVAFTKILFAKKSIKWSING